MLPVYIEGTDVVVTETLPTKSGSPIVATSVEYAVFDETGSTLSARQAVPGWTSGNVTLEVPASVNQLAVDANRSLRTVEFYFSTAADGEYKTRSRYIIQNYSVLELLVNSFQTLDEAFLIATEIPDLSGWEAADENQKLAAMITAHDQICRLSFRFRSDEEADAMSKINWKDYDYTYVPRMRLVTLTDWNTFPERFKRALRRAQVIEADINLAGDPIRDKRMNGIVSETIGESKMFFNNRPPVSLPVSRKTLEALSGYFYYNNRVARSG